MSLFSLLKNKKEEVAILIDIGNGTITGALTVFKRGDKPNFLYVVKKFFTTTEVLEANNLEMEMNSLLEETLSSIIKRGFEHKYWLDNKKKIDRILISFSSPWFLSKTKSIHLTKDKEFIISKSFLDDILSKEMASLKDELKSDVPKESFEVVEKSIVHSKVNGYALEDAIGKSTKHFDASLYMSVVGKDFIRKILDTIHKYTHISKEKISINTFPLIAFSVIRDSFTDESNFILMDVTSEVTDITLVRGDIIEKTVSMPSGRNFIIRQISKTLNITTEIAESSLKLYVAKKLDETILSKITDVIALIEKEWSIYLEDSLLELSPEMNLPNNLFLTSNTDVVDIYINFLTMQKLDATSNFRKNLKINHINLEKMSLFYKNESGYLLDEFIVMLALFYKKLSGKYF